ncbi:MAG: hypothetical protein GTO04_04850, partial [Planctomycetales bacterium]|nr:hypothetical protein [Planctomycetales bacterium]
MRLTDQNNSVVRNFGNARLPAGISGVVWNDRNKNGVRDEGELGLRSMYVYVDVNQDGVPGVGEPGGFTNRDGKYNITGLARG